MHFLDELLMHPGLRLDSSRVILAGTSMGASGVWDVAAHSPTRFAAAVVTAGEGPLRASVDVAISRLRRLPMCGACARGGRNLLQLARGGPRVIACLLGR